MQLKKKSAHRPVLGSRRLGAGQIHVGRILADASDGAIRLHRLNEAGEYLVEVALSLSLTAPHLR